MEFETLLKIIVGVAGTVAIPVAAYAAVAATRAIWVRGAPTEAGGVEELREEVGHLSARVRELEGAERRVAELEERLDFAERVLARQRTPAAELPAPAEPADRQG
jgi:hypothetical protein